jgi:hypothetical protein
MNGVPKVILVALDAGAYVINTKASSIICPVEKRDLIY